MIEHIITEESWNELFHAVVRYFHEFPPAGYGTTVKQMYLDHSENPSAIITRNKTAD